MKIVAIALLVLWLTACAPTTQPEPQAAMSSGDDAILLDAQIYADEMGITLEEETRKKRGLNSQW